MLEPTPLYGGNADFLESLYEQYLRDPASVNDRWRGYFERIGPPVAGERPHGPIQSEIAERARTPRAPLPAQPDLDESRPPGGQGGPAGPDRKAPPPGARPGLFRPGRG